jgi:hypothetical protein
MTGISSSLFFAMLETQTRRQQAEDGIKALIWQYYEDYSDATELDIKYLMALRHVTTTIGLDSAFLNSSLDEVIHETEKEINDFYSSNPPYTGSERHGNHAHIATPGLDIDEED